MNIKSEAKLKVNEPFFNISKKPNFVHFTSRVAGKFFRDLMKLKENCVSRSCRVLHQRKFNKEARTTETAPLIKQGVKESAITPLFYFKTVLLWPFAYII